MCAYSLVFSDPLDTESVGAAGVDTGENMGSEIASLVADGYFEADNRQLVDANPVVAYAADQGLGELLKTEDELSDEAERLLISSKLSSFPVCVSRLFKTN